MRLRIDYTKYPKHLVKVPQDKWPDSTWLNQKPSEIWLSRYFLVQVFDEKNNVVRLTVNRTYRRNGKWDAEITWDELQEIKRQTGRGEQYAVEIYPCDKDIVNVANMRHLWLPGKPLPFGWFR